MPESNEDEIIANAFIKVRDGILTKNWQLVLEAYKDISGEELALPEDPPKSRLEAIREKINPEIKSAKKSRKTKVDKKPKEQGLDGINVVTEKLKGGEKFAKEGFQVISIAPNEEEIAKNKQVALNKTKMPRKEKKTTDRRYNPDDPDREIGYRDRPLVGPPWG